MRNCQHCTNGYCAFPPLNCLFLTDKCTLSMSGCKISELCLLCMLLSNSLEAHTAHTFLRLRCCCELSLTPNVIYASGEQENINNDAVFPTVVCAEAGSCQPAAFPRRTWRERHKTGTQCVCLEWLPNNSDTNN